MTAHPSPDSRIELLHSLTMNGIPTAPPRSWARIVEAMEAAGLVVLDPSSPELAERIADVLRGKFWTFEELLNNADARAVLAALAAPGGEGS